jgi:hypothetical protein
MTEYSEVSAYCGVLPCSSEFVSILDNEGRRNLRECILPKLSFPPAEMINLVVDRGCPFMGEDIGAVALKQVADRVPLGFRGRKVATFKNGCFSDLCPSLGISETRKRCYLCG